MSKSEGNSWEYWLKSSVNFGCEQLYALLQLSTLSPELGMGLST